MVLPLSVKAWVRAGLDFRLWIAGWRGPGGGRPGTGWPCEIGRLLGGVAPSDRVSSQAGAGRSCARVERGHTPLQVSRNGTPCGTMCLGKSARGAVRRDVSGSSKEEPAKVHALPPLSHTTCLSRLRAAHDMTRRTDTSSGQATRRPPSQNQPRNEGATAKTTHRSASEWSGQTARSANRDLPGRESCRTHGIGP